MANSAITEHTLRRWLLGKLSDARRERLEELLFQSNLTDRLDAAETDLIDDYVRGRLSQSDNRAVEARLLVRPAEDQRLRVASALARHVRKQNDPLPDRRRVRLLLVAGLALLAIAIPLWTGFAPTPPTSVPTVSILDAQVRADGVLQVAVPENAARLRLQFEIAEPGTTRNLTLSVRTADGGKLARLNDLPLKRAGAYRYVEVLLPAAQLTAPGEKVVEIHADLRTPPLASWRLRFVSG